MVRSKALIVLLFILAACTPVRSGEVVRMYYHPDESGMRWQSGTDCSYDWDNNYTCTPTMDWVYVHDPEYWEITLEKCVNEYKEECNRQSHRVSKDLFDSLEEGQQYSLPEED